MIQRQEGGNHKHGAEQAEFSCSLLPRCKLKTHFTLLFSAFCFSPFLPFLLKFAEGGKKEMSQTEAAAYLSALCQAKETIPPHLLCELSNG